MTNYENELIIVSGGREIKFQLDEVEVALQTVDVYLIEKDKWIIAPDMINARLSHSSCVLGEYIYVTGGHDGYVAFNRIERLNLAQL